MCTPVTTPICFSYVYHPIHQRLSCFVCCSLFYVNIPQIFLPCFWDNTIYYLIQCLRFTITNKVWGTYGQSFMDWKARKTENLWDQESCLIWWLEPSLHHLKSRLTFLVSDFQAVTRSIQQAGQASQVLAWNSCPGHFSWHGSWTSGWNYVSLVSVHEIFWRRL